jgi:hypothetical protein
MALIKLNTRSLSDDSVTTDKIVNDGNLGRRNLLINGGMQVAQRGNTFTVTNEYGLDRWFCRENTDGALTFSQDSESPAGFSQSLKVNVDTADSSIGSSQFAYVAQRMEGYTIEPLAFGSSDAKKITLSFYVRCSVTGKFGGAIVNGDNNNRSHAFTYDVDAADTWERKTITFDGDTTGTWNIDNSQEMAVIWSMGGGSGVKKSEGSWDATTGVQSATEADTELVETASATWFMTGAQLELGDTATPFEHRSYGEELLLCQRYYREDEFNVQGYPGTSGYAHCQLNWAPMRAAPSATLTDGSVAGKSGVATNTYNICTTGCRVENQASGNGRLHNLGGDIKLNAEL